MIKNSVFAFLGPRGVFPFLFEQIPSISYYFRPDLAEARKIRVDVLLKRQCLSHRAYAPKAIQSPSLYSDKLAI